MITFAIVKPEEWLQIEGPMKAVLGNDMPVTPEQATFLGAYDDGKLVGWIHIEHVYHFNSVYLEAQYRQSRLGLKLIQEAASHIPAGHSAIWLTDRNVANKIAQLIGARNLGNYQVFRKDV